MLRKNTILDKNSIKPLPLSVNYYIGTKSANLHKLIGVWMFEIVKLIRTFRLSELIVYWLNTNFT